MSLNLGSDVSIRDQWARQHAIRGIKEIWNENYLNWRPGDTPWPPLDVEQPGLPPLPLQFKDPKPPPLDPPQEPKIINIGIVGAGVAGLFAARVLDNINWELFRRAWRGYQLRPEDLPKDIDEFYRRSSDPFKTCPLPPLWFKYDVLEASAPDRVGGRLFTYDFGGQRKDHDYYDVGAMRFPDNPVMTRTFDLFADLGMRKTDLEGNPNARDGSLIPYYMKNADTASTHVEPWCYNDITLWGTYNGMATAAQNNDPFKVATDGSIPSSILRHSPDKVMNAAIEPFRNALRRDVEKHPPGREGWDLLMTYDMLSTRQYLEMDPPEKLEDGDIPPPPYNFETIQWMETFNGGTDWYDQAFSETVLESMDFQYDDEGETKWWCVLGGAQQMAKALEARIWRKPQYNTKVRKIKAAGRMKVVVEAELPKNATKTTTYDGLLNTTSLGCLRKMDLREAGMNYATRQAMRSLEYGAASKVAIKFRRAWWIHDLGDYSIKKGGLGHSDLNGRICVYPSYNIYDDKTQTAVLLCSYTWQQDAQRIAALISKNKNHETKVAEESELKELLIRGLVQLHRNPAMSDDKLYKLISDNYIDHHAHAWGNDPTAMGSFAFFRPQQFTHMWNKMIQPSGDVVIAGEAASPHHAWVVGALESVIHGLHAWMALNRVEVPELALAMKILEEEKEDNPYTGLPPYMEKEVSEWQGLLGLLNREEHLGQDTQQKIVPGLGFSDIGLVLPGRPRASS